MLSKLPIRKSCVLQILRSLLTSFLIFSFIAYDITWASPDLETSSRKLNISTLAIQSFFKTADPKVRTCARMLLEYLEFRHNVPLERLGLEAVEHILIDLQDQPWFQESIKYQRNAGAILISIGNEHALRYCESDSKSLNSLPGAYKIEESVPLGALVRQALVLDRTQDLSADRPAPRRIRLTAQERIEKSRERIKKSRESADKLWKKVCARADKASTPEEQSSILAKGFLDYVDKLKRIEGSWQKLFDPICKEVFKGAPELQAMLRIPPELPVALTHKVPPDDIAAMAKLGIPPIVPVARRINALRFIHKSLGPERSDNIVLFTTDNIFRDRTALIAVSRDRDRLSESITRDVVGGLGANIVDEWTLRTADGDVAIVYILDDAQTHKQISKERVLKLRTDIKTIVTTRYVWMPQIIADAVMSVEALHAAPADPEATRPIREGIQAKLPLIRKEVEKIKHPGLDPEDHIKLSTKSSNDLPKVGIGVVHRYDVPAFQVAAYSLGSDEEVARECDFINEVLGPMKTASPGSPELAEYITDLKKAILEDVSAHRRRAVVKVEELLKIESQSKDAQAASRTRILQEANNQLENHYYSLKGQETEDYKKHVTEIFLRRGRILEKAAKDFPFLKDLFDQFKSQLCGIDNTGGTLKLLLGSIDTTGRRIDEYLTTYAIPAMIKLSADVDEKMSAIGKEMASMYIDILSEVRKMDSVTKRRVKPAAQQGDTIIVAKSFDIISFLALWSIYEEEHKGGRPIAAVVAEEGSARSHWVMVATFLGIPVVTAPHNKDFDITNGCDVIENNRNVIVDAESGNVLVNPTNKELQEALAKRQRLEQVDEFTKRRANLPAGLGMVLHGGDRTEASGPTPTKISIYQNVDFAMLLTDYIQRSLMRLYGDGVGLVRSEFEFTRDVNALASRYSSLAKKFPERDVTIRTIDYEPDKSGNPALPRVPDDKKAMHTGIEYYKYEGSEVIMLQLKAILKAYYEQRNIRVMFPMIRGTDDLNYVLGLLEQAKESVAKELKIRKDELAISVGAMIETPAAVYQLTDILKQVDFISFGTNDLIRFTYGVNRDSVESQDVYQNFKKEIALAIKKACEISSELNQPSLFSDGASQVLKDVSICGDAGRSQKYFLYFLWLQAKYPRAEIHPSVPNQYIPWLKEMMCWVSFDEIDNIFSRLSSDRPEVNDEMAINRELESLIEKIHNRVFSDDSEPYKRFLLSKQEQVGEKSVPRKVPSMDEIIDESSFRILQSADTAKISASFKLLLDQIHHAPSQVLARYMSLLSQHIGQALRAGMREDAKRRLLAGGVTEAQLTEHAIDEGLMAWVEEQAIDKKFLEMKDEVMRGYLRKVKGLKGSELQAEVTAMTAGHKQVDEGLSQELTGISRETAVQKFREDMRHDAVVSIKAGMYEDAGKEYDNGDGLTFRAELQKSGLSGEELEKSYKKQRTDVVEKNVQDGVDADIAAHPERFKEVLAKIRQQHLEKLLNRLVRDKAEHEISAKGYKITLALCSNEGVEIESVVLREEDPLLDPKFVKLATDSKEKKVMKITVENWPEAQKIAKDIVYIINSNGRRPPQEEHVAKPQAPPSETGEVKAKGPGPTDMAHPAGPVTIMSKVHDVALPQLQAVASASGRKILLSISLFNDKDVIALSSAINKDIVEIVDLAEIQRRATNVNATKEKIACVMARSDFVTLQAKGLHKENNHATLVVLEQDLQDERYLYTEGVIGFASALMDSDRQRMQAYSDIIFDSSIGDKILDLLLNDSHVSVFNIVKLLKFKPVEALDVNNLPQLKGIMENYLRAA